MRRLAAQHILPWQWLEGWQGLHSGTQVSHLGLTASETLSRPIVPRIVAVILRRFVVVAAGVLMIALANGIGNVAKAVLRVHVAHETLPSAAVRTGELTGLMARESLGL